MSIELVEAADGLVESIETFVGNHHETQSALRELHRNFEALEGAAEDAVATMRGEADELEARDDVDDHLSDVIAGLRWAAEELEDTIEHPPGDDSLEARP